MATILLGAAGAAVGAGFGGTVLGLSGAVIGRAIGATLGRVIDQRVAGAGSETVEVGRVERFRLMGASDGAPVGRVWGRARVAGQVIWATRFLETISRSGGGKGTPRPRTDSYSYTVSLAVALCEGVIAGVGRVWADGMEIDARRLSMRVYPGDEAQLPDPKIEAVEGSGLAPAFRGIAYVVIEDLPLGDYGNRVPQLNFEVLRHAAVPGGLDDVVQAVALIPGTGEYALATEPVRMIEGRGTGRLANVNTPTGEADFPLSLRQLRSELPKVGSVSLIVSWFGNDLRAGQCEVRPRVEQALYDGRIPWRAGGIGRTEALSVPLTSGLPVYGGTPSDASILQAISAIRAGGQEVMFYPFVLMEQLAGNGLPDPWSDAPHQPVLPWRGRITTAKAPGRIGTTDRTAAAEAEVAAFFGAAQPSHFTVSADQVFYSGPANDWGYRRFILHYARLCALAGGVDAFCIGSELRGVTQIRGAGDSFPAVAALRVLAAEVRAILGPATKISYAADWTEYFGYHADGNVYFHLDPLWADPNIGFVGIDNYMPLSDWRGQPGEADAAYRSIHNLDYLRANVAGGEGYDWYYDSEEGRAAQRRLPIEDGAHGEPWVFRYKDIRGWWSNPHHERIGGTRSPVATAWVPGSKPIRFTEYGCAAVDKGSNEPNKFLDPKSSESALPRYSEGRRDDLIAMQYYRAVATHWADPAANPQATLYAGTMVDMARAHAWAWDARPFPAFPNNVALWSDGDNYDRGHWLNGRAMNQPLSSVIAEVCARSGLADVETGEAYGVVRGFTPDGIAAARAVLQPLMLAHAVDAVERGGELAFVSRGLGPEVPLTEGGLAKVGEIDGAVETQRAAEAEMTGRVRLAYLEAEGDFSLRQAEAVFPDERSAGASQTDLPLLLTPAEGRGIAERWLAEARVARDGLRLALPPSAAALGAGDVIAVNGGTYRLDRVEVGDAALVEAVRIEASVYRPSDAADARVVPAPFVAPGPVDAVFLDLPLLKGTEVPHAPHVAATGRPWPGSVAVWSALEPSDGFEINTLLAVPAVIGTTETALDAAPHGLWDRGEPLRVRLASGTLSSASLSAVLNGANAMAIGDGASDPWEVFQFATATLVAPGVWDLSMRLRGQSGTDALMPSSWPAGSTVVLLDAALSQVSLALSARGLARTWRIGASARGFDDPDAVERVEAFSGVGLRPYAPAHLRLRPEGADRQLTWVRRTRVDGDNWASTEVPLGEDREAYVVRVIDGSTVKRSVEVTVAGFLYTDAMRAEDALSGPATFAVAQLSDRFGPGPFRTLAEA
jgi:hypothetical protein